MMALEPPVTLPLGTSIGMAVSVAVPTKSQLWSLVMMSVAVAVA